MKDRSKTPSDRRPTPPGDGGDLSRVPTSYRFILSPRRDKSAANESHRGVAGEATVAGPVAGHRGQVGPASGSPMADPDAATIVSDRPPVSPVPEAPTPPARGVYFPGNVLAHRYRLLEPIGEGGMGSVWRARSLGLDLDVAVKLIRPDTVVQNAAERLLKEARAAARVVHPAAVRVFDYSVTEQGDPFLVMEFLTGTSLAARLAESGPLSARDAVELLLPVIGALVVAHREGIVHRDIKPANIMLVQDEGRMIPKLIDFGIAGIRAAIWSKKLTTHGMLLGSPIYMAPEQLRGGGGEPDERTDVWGACTVLYELVAGKRPFGGKSAPAVIFDILGAKLPHPPELTAHPKLWSIVERGLSKSPEDRWATMAALGRALAGWAVANGATCDVTGASLAVHWLDRSSRA